MPRESKLSGGIGFWLVLAVIVAVLLEGAIAFVNINDCGKTGDKSWEPFPPHWECATPQP